MSVTGSLSGSWIDSANDAHNLQSLQLSDTKNVTSGRDPGEPSGIFPFQTQHPLDFSSLSGKESVQQSSTTFFGAFPSPSHDSMTEYPKHAMLAAAQANFDVPDLPFNPSECGFVHLPPISASTSRHESVSSTLNVSNSSVHAVSVPGTGNEPTASDGYHSGSSMGRRGPSTDATVYSTFQFQHAQDEHGHHVIIGREGELRRCEDEVHIASVE